MGFLGGTKVASSSTRLELLDLVQRFGSLMGLEIDHKLLKNLLIVLALISDRETGQELVKILRRV